MADLEATVVIVKEVIGGVMLVRGRKVTLLVDLHRLLVESVEALGVDAGLLQARHDFKKLPEAKRYLHKIDPMGMVDFESARMAKIISSACDHDMKASD